MSTSIYNAYRMRKSSDLWPFLREIQERIRPVILTEMRHRIGTEFCDVSVSKDEALYYSSENHARWAVAKKRVWEKYLEASDQPFISEYDFDACVAIREHKKRLYLIHYSGQPVRNVFRFLREDSRVEEYGYWSSTDDMPSGVTRRMWLRRRATWDAIHENWDSYLSFDISSPRSMAAAYTRIQYESSK